MASNWPAAPAFAFLVGRCHYLGACQTACLPDWSCGTLLVTMSISIYTIGYGGRSIEDLLATLKRERVRFLIDVRSNPVSQFNPDFSADPLRGKLQSIGIRYVYMGDTLGGRPKDETCYENGHVIYARVLEKSFFKTGIERLLKAYTHGIRVCLFCSEIRPEDCQRSKMISVSHDADIPRSTSAEAKNGREADRSRPAR
ncbi:MAG TPA: DUF488 domain-containing protein [Candidatus Solibacter sp.]|nr:DUF488 domain-containing protein [Candidatus Solibacter sp.]